VPLFFKCDTTLDCALKSPGEIVASAKALESKMSISMEKRILKDVKNCLNTNIYSHLETSGGQSSNLYLKVVHFLTPILIRQLWQLKTYVFLHWCLISTVMLLCEIILT
jgi:hypothetical protein